MRIKSYDGTIKRVKPVVEKRFRFNGRTVRMAETACSAKEDATGLYFEFARGQSEWMHPCENAFLGHEGTVFDEGKTKPYLSVGMAVGMQSPFTGVPIQGEDSVNSPDGDDIGDELEDMRSAIFQREDCKYSISELAEMSEEDLREIYAMVNGEE